MKPNIYSLSSFKKIVDDIFYIEIRECYDERDLYLLGKEFPSNYKSHINNLLDSLVKHLQNFSQNIVDLDMLKKRLEECYNIIDKKKPTIINLSLYPFETIEEIYADGFNPIVSFEPYENYELHENYKYYLLITKEVRELIYEYLDRYDIKLPMHAPNLTDEIKFITPSLDHNVLESVADGLIAKKFFRKESREPLIKYLKGTPDKEKKIIYCYKNEHNKLYKAPLAQFFYELQDIGYYGTDKRAISWKDYVDPYFVYSNGDPCININKGIKKIHDKIPNLEPELRKILSNLK